MDIGIQNLDEVFFDYIGGALEFRVKNSKNIQRGVTYLPGLWKMKGLEIKSKL